MCQQKGRNSKITSMLPHNFIPSSCDIICGKGKDCYDHIGNKWFRHIVSLYIDEYLAAGENKFKKIKIVSAIFNKVQESGNNTGFVSKDRRSGEWRAVSVTRAREKIGHELRIIVSRREKKAEKSKKLYHEAQKFRRLYVIQQAIFVELKAKSDMEIALVQDEEMDEVQCTMMEDNVIKEIDDTDLMYMLGLD
mmetsp:Transcript_9318/g.12513  ORF Transcript_9318/g.12513 Transcript_9318/m.12513 type:complete len:193 (+) Transcript_9318:77-655(+)